MTRIHGVGIDVVDARRIGRLLASSGTRFTSRWFTEAEMRQGFAEAQPSLAFAVRFAAKEAVWKSLSPAEADRPPWRQIEILAETRGYRVRLAGEFGAAAATAGVAAIEVTGSASGDLATAFAIAYLGVEA